MSDNESTTPFGPGFVAACIVVAAVVTCGVVLLIAGPASPATTTLANPAAAANAEARVEGGAGVGGEAGAGVGPGARRPQVPATPGTSCPDAAPGTTDAAPTTNTGPGTTNTGPGTDAGPGAGSRGDSASGAANPGVGGGSGSGDSASGDCTPSSRSTCSLPAGDQTVPAAAPAVDGWEVSRRVVVPRSARFGPAVTDSDGFRRCFAHSPTGAVFAAYNVLAALGDPAELAASARKLMVPGPDTDELLRQTAKESPSTASEATQLAGYRVIAANRDQVTVMLAVPVEAQYMSLTLTMVWHDHDWRLQPPSPGAAVGAPFAQVRSLADFVKWSGL